MDNLNELLEQASDFHAELFELWDDLPDISVKRAIAVIGFCRIVQQHVVSQHLLLGAGLHVTAMTLVRPTYEALVRAAWCLSGAPDSWIDEFLSPPPEGARPDEETSMGPSVDSMLRSIQESHPIWIHQTLVELKKHTWKPMCSYVHGGIRPVVQSLSDLPEEKQCAVLINANGMLLLATNAMRMACGIGSPMLPDLQRRHAECLPPARPLFATSSVEAEFRKKGGTDNF